MDKTAVQVVDLTLGLCAHAAQALAEGLATEPSAAIILDLSSPSTRRRLGLALECQLRAFVAAGQPGFVAVVEGKAVGAVVVGRPHTGFPWARTGLCMILALPRLLPLAWRLRHWWWPWPLLRARRSLGTSPASAYHLRLLAVRPDWQGKGVGTQLMEKVHALCDRDQEASGVWLTTAGARNRSIYERWGYRVLDSVNLGELPMYSMFRPRPMVPQR